ncbi:MI domain-containing protein [Aphis craccivora]|uniref:MI domain-containing protein n=1 Tax=Aphis craccivora TaxID=307492 RepID=A0A6G0WGJ2_APHCR|nr:MI domain-containing protein [Aphis craccivora]
MSLSNVMGVLCSGLSVSELKCLCLKYRLLKFFCTGCDKGLKELTELKSLLNKLLVEVDNLKSNLGNTQNLSNDFIINEINECNKRANNVIFYNIQESNSN